MKYYTAVATGKEWSHEERIHIPKETLNQRELSVQNRRQSLEKFRSYLLLMCCQILWREGKA